jgi:hypothetical protein
MTAQTAARPPPRRDERAGRSGTDFTIASISLLDRLGRAPPGTKEFDEALLGAAILVNLSGKWQAAILEAEQNVPQLRVLTSD